MKIPHQRIWFSSDQHFSHRNVIEYDNLPFKDIKEHDDMLCHYWNAVVKPKDMVFVLGDFCFGNMGTVTKFVQRLNGQIQFVKGNHDKPVEQWSKKKNRELPNLLEIKVAEPASPRKWQEIVMCHYPMASWNKAHYGAWHLYGHTHGDSWYDRDFQPKYQCHNVGVNSNGFTPVSYAQLKLIMFRKDKLKHHGRVIAPNEVANTPIPDEVIGIVNGLIQEEQIAGTGTFYQSDLIGRVYRELGEFKNDWLFFDDIVKRAGWDIQYHEAKEDKGPCYSFNNKD